MSDDLIRDVFEFELPVWVLVDKQDVIKGQGGREHIKFPARIEAATIEDPAGLGPYVQVYTDEDLAMRGLERATNPNARAFAIRKRAAFMQFLREVLGSGIRYIGLDKTNKRAAAMDITDLLKKDQ